MSQSSACKYVSAVSFLHLLTCIYVTKLGYRVTAMNQLQEIGLSKVAVQAGARCSSLIAVRGTATRDERYSVSAWRSRRRQA